MLTTIKDIDVDILSYDDLENYCFTNKYNYDICKNDTRIQYKLEHISKMVNSVLEEVKTKGTIKLLPNNQTTSTYINIMDKHNINHTSHTKISISRLNVTTIIIFKTIITGNFYIHFHVSSYMGHTLIYTQQLTVKQLKEILFNLFYDNLVKVNIL
jgi:hypothetical protein